MLDNVFTNGTGTVQPQQFHCGDQEQFCHVVMDYNPWPQTTGMAILAGNRIDGHLANSSEVLPCYPLTPGSNQLTPTCAEQQKLVIIRDLEATEGDDAPPLSGLTVNTRFLKSWWSVFRFVLFGAIDCMPMFIS
jgi:hypothetical protein